MSGNGRWLGLDIGGANLKAATARGVAKHLAFPLWRRPEELAGAIGRLLEMAPRHEGVAVTMTGELADCFETKAEGVAAIVSAVEQALAGRPSKFYTLRGTFLDAHSAVEEWRLVAAANWHALATAVARKMTHDHFALLIDVGSTTTDIVPFGSKLGPSDDAPDDTDRLARSQLLYQGVARTPVCALVDRLPYRGDWLPVAAELFATTADIAMMLGETSASRTVDTADGRPLSEKHSAARLARMICADRTRFGYDDAVEAARYVAEQMEERLAAALANVLTQVHQPPQAFYLSGEGEWLARRALSRIKALSKAKSLADGIGRRASLCGPAWAVATLAESGLESGGGEA